jgi:hypothetical protein
MSIRKILGRTGLVLAALVAGLLVVRAVLNYTAGKRLEKFLAEAKAKGLAVSYTDLGPSCPGLENARPLWKAAAALFDAGYRAKANLNPELAKLFEAQTLDEKSRSIIRTGIEKNRRSIDLLREASARPCFREIDRRVPSDSSSLSDDFIRTLHLIKLLGFEALFRAESGDIRGGLTEWAQGFQFVRLTMQEPEIITALCAIANAKSLLVFLNRIVDGRAIEVDDLKAVLNELDAEAWRAAVTGSWKGERILWMETGTEVLRGHLEAFEWGRERRFLFWLARPWVRSQIMRQYSVFDEIEDMFRMPYYKSRPRMNAYDSRQERLPWYKRLTDAPGEISAMGMKNACVEALLETARIGLAARIFSAREKRFPSAVADLVPSVLPREPLDPFTGKPFVYRADKDGLLVYSLGSNEKDDGGRGTFLIAQLVTPKDDDWAWRDSFRPGK